MALPLGRCAGLSLREMLAVMSSETVELLRGALRGERLCREELVKRIDQANGPEQIALHQLLHWVEDADVRARDPGYAELLRVELSRLLSELGSTAP